MHLGYLLLLPYQGYQHYLMNQTHLIWLRQQYWLLQRYLRCHRYHYR